LSTLSLEHLVSPLLPRTDGGNLARTTPYSTPEQLTSHLQPHSSTATFQSYFNRALSAVKNPGSLLQSTASTTANAPASVARNISTAQVAGGAVLLAEVLGFFTVGEMIGRFKLVGYHGDTGAHH
jgi:hypothetical protein